MENRKIIERIIQVTVEDYPQAKYVLEQWDKKNPDAQEIHPGAMKRICLFANTGNMYVRYPADDDMDYDASILDFPKSGITRIHFVTLIRHLNKIVQDGEDIVQTANDIMMSSHTFINKNDLHPNACHFLELLSNKDMDGLTSLLALNGFEITTSPDDEGNTVIDGFKPTLQTLSF